MGKGPGRPPKICLEIGRDKLKVADSSIDQLLKSQVRKFTGSSGAYIPIWSKYEDRQVIVLVLDKGVELDD